MRATIGRGHLSRFQELETESPVILTTSQLLTTGVDAPTCKNIVIARMIGSMTEFKQIIGRGTRVREDYGKLFFNILDYTGSATRLFADPGFRRRARADREEVIDDEGEVVEPDHRRRRGTSADDGADRDRRSWSSTSTSGRARKYYFDGGSVEIAAHSSTSSTREGKQLRVVSYTDYTGEKVAGTVSLAAALGPSGPIREQRAAIIDALAERGIELEELGELAAVPTPTASTPLPPGLQRAAAHASRARRATHEGQRVSSTVRPGSPRDPERADREVHRARTRAVPTARHPQGPAISAHGNSSEIASIFGGARAAARSGRRARGAALCGLS